MAVQTALVGRPYRNPSINIPIAPLPIAARAPVTLAEILRVSQPNALRQRLARGQAIFSDGDSTDQVYELVSGTVRLCKHTPGGRRHILDFVTAGELFGLIEHAEHTVTAEAVTDVVIVSYSRSQLDRQGAADTIVRRRVLAAVSDSLLVAQQQLLILGCQDAKERLASFFLRLAGRNGLKDGQRLALPMGRQDIADHLGLTIETVCRTIRALHRAQIVTVPNTHEIALTDMRALRALAVEE
jgi:CRP/FNR family nitrogen fixation transcriptional regulator